jgi:uncharacterized FlgJ-related protein
MSKNKLSRKLSPLLMTLVGVATLLLCCVAPQGPLPYSRTLAKLAWRQESDHHALWHFPRLYEGPVGAPKGVYMMPTSVDMVRRFYAAHEAENPGAPGHLVPCLYTLTLPTDIRLIKNGEQKREVFIQMVLPLILKANARILGQRAHLLAIDYRKRQGLPLTRQDQFFLKHLAHEYKVPTLSIPLLLRRVDMVPPSLALAQAMLESGNGTSAAALQKRSIFGHMTTLTQVAAFPTLMDSVSVYIRNLNRNGAYKPFQTIRHELRQKSKPLCGIKLADGLVKYSILGRAYVKKIQDLIRLYKLDQYDTKQLFAA